MPPAPISANQCHQRPIMPSMPPRPPVEKPAAEWSTPARLERHEARARSGTNWAQATPCYQDDLTRAAMRRLPASSAGVPFISALGTSPFLCPNRLKSDEFGLDLQLFTPPPNRRKPCIGAKNCPPAFRHNSICKQEVGGSIPPGSISELPANWPVLGLSAATGHGRDQAEIKHRFWGAAGRRLSDDAGSLGLGSGSTGSRVRRGSNPRPAPHRDPPPAATITPASASQLGDQRRRREHIEVPVEDRIHEKRRRGFLRGDERGNQDARVDNDSGHAVLRRSRRIACSSSLAIRSASSSESPLIACFVALRASSSRAASTSTVLIAQVAIPPGYQRAPPGQQPQGRSSALVIRLPVLRRYDRGSEPLVLAAGPAAACRPLRHSAEDRSRCPLCLLEELGLLDC